MAASVSCPDDVGKSPVATECAGCKMTLRKITLIVSDKASMLEFLYSHNVLRRELLCVSCGVACRLSNENMFRCGRMLPRPPKNNRCRFSQSLLKNTWFSGSHMSMDTVCMFTVYWCVIHPPRSNFFETQLGLSKGSIVDWSSFCRELCIDWCERTKQKIGGEGVIVEIDEAIFGAPKRKNKAGDTVKGQWVFGGFERGSKKVFVVAVEDRSKETLLAAIKEWILPGTTIYSSCWKAYDCLGAEGFVHSTVDHAYHFVDPVTQTHTQHIERTWREVRATVPRYGRRKAHYYGYLCEFLWKRSFPDLTDRIHSIFKDLIAVKYNPSCEDDEPETERGQCGEEAEGDSD